MSNATPPEYDSAKILAEATVPEEAAAHRRELDAAARGATVPNIIRPPEIEFVAEPIHEFLAKEIKPRELVLAPWLPTPAGGWETGPRGWAAACSPGSAPAPCTRPSPSAGWPKDPE